MVEALCSGKPALDSEDLFARNAQFTECITSGALTELLNEELEALLEQPTNLPPNSSETVWTVCEGEACTLRLLSLPQLPRENGYNLQGSAAHRMLALASPGAVAEIAIYHHQHGDVGHFDRNNHLSADPIRTLAQGETVQLRAWMDVAEWIPRPGLALAAVLASPVVLDQYWVYRRETLQPLELVSATYKLNRLQYALELLAAIGDPAKAATTASLYEHAAHHIRWAAVKATIDLDVTLGRSLLQRATRDPHPHVAKAAKAGLQALEAQGL